MTLPVDAYLDPAAVKLMASFTLGMEETAAALADAEGRIALALSILERAPEGLSPEARIYLACVALRG